MALLSLGYPPARRRLPLIGFITFIGLSILGLCVAFIIGFDNAIDNAALKPENTSIWINIIWVPFLGPMVEEFFFRLLPVLVVILFIKNRPVGSTRSAVLFAGIVSSLLFGFVHGNWYNLLIQGSLGLILFWVFIKYARNLKTENLKKCLFDGWIASSIVHVTYNCICFIILLLGQMALRAQASA